MNQMLRSILLGVIVISYTHLFASDTPFTVKKPTIQQGIHAIHWEDALTTPIKITNPDDDIIADSDNISFEKEITTESNTIQTEEAPDDDRESQKFEEQERVDDEPDALEMVAVVPPQSGRKWGEWYGTTPHFEPRDHLAPQQTQQKNAPPLPLEQTLPKHDTGALLDGFSLSLWGDSSLVINAGANYTWKYLYSAVSFGTDLYTPAIDRPYFLDIRTGGSYPFSSFLVRTDIGYRLNLNQHGGGSSNFKQHQFELRAAAGYRFNSWLLLIGGTGIGYGFDGTKEGKLSPVFFGGVELF